MMSEKDEAAAAAATGANNPPEPAAEVAPPAADAGAGAAAAAGEPAPVAAPTASDDDATEPAAEATQEMAASAEKGAEGAKAAPAPPPTRMVKSVVLTGSGGFEKLKVKPWALASAPAAGQLEVTVVACGLNFADIYTRRGLHRERSPPCVIGLECAGTVSAVGDGVDNFKVGDRVVCYQYTGDLYREMVIVPAANTFHLPDDISLEHGAAIVVNFLAAYFCLLDIGNLRAGQSVLIHSCAGGLGWAATQIANTVEHVTVFGTASANKHDAAKANGVTHVLNLESYEQELLAQSPRGVDIIIDNQGGSNVASSMRLLKPLGRVIIVGMNSLVSSHHKSGFMDILRSFWPSKSVNTLDLLMGNRVVAGLHLGKILEQEPERFQRALTHIFQLYTMGKIAPKIDSEYPLDQANLHSSPYWHMCMGTPRRRYRGEKLFRLPATEEELATQSKALTSKMKAMVGKIGVSEKKNAKDALFKKNAKDAFFKSEKW